MATNFSICSVGRVMHFSSVCHIYWEHGLGTQGRFPVTKQSLRFANPINLDPFNSLRFKHAVANQEFDNVINAFAGFHIGKDKGPVPSHPAGVLLHNFKGCADQRC